MAKRIFPELPPEEQLPKSKTLKENFLDALPATFNRSDYLKIASSLSITEKTTERYIAEFVKNNLVLHEQRDFYVNPYAKSP